MPLSNLEGFFWGHQEQTHLLPSVSWGKQQIGLTQILVPFWQEPGCATKAWQPAEPGALPMQEDGKVVGNPSRSDQSSPAQLPHTLAQRRVRAGRAEHQSCPRRRAGDAETDNSPCSSQHLLCYSNQSSRKRPLRLILSGRGKGWLRSPRPHLVTRVVAASLTRVPSTREQGEKG